MRAIDRELIDFLDEPYWNSYYAACILSGQNPTKVLIGYQSLKGGAFLNDLAPRKISMLRNKMALAEFNYARKLLPLNVEKTPKEWINIAIKNGWPPRWLHYAWKNPELRIYLPQSELGTKIQALGGTTKDKKMYHRIRTTAYEIWLSEINNINPTKTKALLAKKVEEALLELHNKSFKDEKTVLNWIYWFDKIKDAIRAPPKSPKWVKELFKDIKYPSASTK